MLQCAAGVLEPEDVRDPLMRLQREQEALRSLFEPAGERLSGGCLPERVVHFHAVEPLRIVFEKPLLWQTRRIEIWFPRRVGKPRRTRV